MEQNIAEVLFVHDDTHLEDADEPDEEEEDSHNEDICDEILKNLYNPDTPSILEEEDSVFEKRSCKRKIGDADRNNQGEGAAKLQRLQPSPPSPPSTSCDQEVSKILTQPPLSPPAPYSANSSLQTDLAITPSPNVTVEHQEKHQDPSSVQIKIVQPRFINRLQSSVDTELFPPSLSSPLNSSPIISSPLYSPHSPGYNIPSPGSAFSIVSPRRRISCESDRGSGVELATVEENQDNTAPATNSDAKETQQESSNAMCQENQVKKIEQTEKDTLGQDNR